MILNDAEILQHISSNKLISKNADASCVSGASYELRASKFYFDLTENPNVRITADTNNKILIKPFHKVVLISEEELDIPDNIIGRVATKGKLFSIGLSAIHTYADPGFKGNLGLVFYNFSPKYIQLDILEHIAKLDFSQLTGQAQRTYQGQHGFSAQVWPIPSYMQCDFEDIKTHTRAKTSALEEAYSILPKEISNTIKYLVFLNRYIFQMVIGLLVGNIIIACLFVFEKITDAAAAIFINLLSSFIIFVYAMIIKKRS